MDHGNIKDIPNVLAKHKNTKSLFTKVRKKFVLSYVSFLSVANSFLTKKVTGANGTPMGGQDRSYTATVPVLPDSSPDNGVQNSEETEETPAPSGEISTVEKKKKDSKKRKRAPIEAQVKLLLLLGRT